MSKSWLDAFLGKDSETIQSSTDLASAATAGTQTYAGYSSATIGGVDLATIMSMYAPLSKEESEELDNLKKEHNNEVKVAKLAAFKKLSPEMRQFIVNLISVHASVKKINDTTVDKSQRLKDLESKEAFTRGSTSTTWAQYSGVNIYDPFSNKIKVQAIEIDGISLEEIQQAHVEATVEEEMLNGSIG